MDTASWLGLPPGAFWKSCVEFWVAALVLLVASAVATREVGVFGVKERLPERDNVDTSERGGRAKEGDKR